MRRKIIIFCLAAAVTASLCPATAWADTAEAAGQTEGEAPVLEQGKENSDSPNQQAQEETAVPEASWQEETETVVGGTGSSDVEEGGMPEEITVYGTADLDMDENGILRSADSMDWDTMIQNTVSWMRDGENEVLNDSFLSGVSSTATDWYVFSLGRLGIQDNYSGFLAAADTYVREMYEQNPSTGLSSTNATEWHRLTMAVLAAGGDPTSTGGRNLIADGVYNCLSGEPWEQGINGAIWGLLALDSRGYAVPEDATYTREDLIGYILDQELRRGGWALSGNTADADMTAMAIYALAPYCAADAEVQSAVDSGLSILRNGISADGDLQSGGDYNCESTAQAIVAFCAMGIDPATVVSPETGNSLLDGLVKYYNTDTGGFKHLSSTRASNGMATGQAMYAIAAYRMYRQGISVWDFRNPANTSGYVVVAGDTTYTAAAGTDAVIQIAEGTSSIQITNVPVGNYDMAVVSAGETVLGTAFGRGQDGNTPVTVQTGSDIPVEDGTVLTVAVTRQNGTTETWTLTVQMAASAEVQALISQIAALPEADELTLDDAAAVEAAKAAWDRLSPESQAQVENSGKLTELLARLEQLRQEEEEALSRRREELAGEIRAIQTPVRISDKTKVNQYLLELGTLGEWDEKAALEEMLNGYLSDIAEREALVAALDQDIWDQIDPLRVDQGDEACVQALMARYSTLRVEEQGMLSNGQSLLDAAAVIQSLREGVIPARVFQNLRSTGETFVYEGVTSDGHAYTLTYEGNTVQAASDVAAGIRITTDTGAAAGAALLIEFDQQGSMNGTAALRIATDAEEGSYSLYWLNPDSLTIQSAGSGRIASGYAGISVRMGGRYWLSENVVRLDGNAADGSVEAVSSGSGQTETTVRGTGSSGSSGGSTGSGRNTASDSGSRQTSGSQSAAASSGSSSGSSGQTVTDAAAEGIMSQAELESIQGDRSRNLRTSGKLTDTIAYTVTVNGEDVKNTDEFAVRIKTDCSHAEDIHALAASPLVLCMEDMETFPGTILVRLTTDLEDGNQLLFQFDPEGRQAEYVKTVTVEDGEIAFTLDEGGDYFIARRALAGSLNDPDTEEEQQVIAAETEEFGTPTPWDETAETVVTGTGAAETGFAWALPLGIIAACAAVAAAGGAVLYIRRKRGKKQ